MKIYTITPRPFGEDAMPKEMRYLVATARAEGERTIAVDCRPCSAYLQRAARHAAAALKREGKIDFYVRAERFTQEDTGAAFLLAREPELADEPLLRERCEGVLVIAL